MYNNSSFFIVFGNMDLNFTTLSKIINKSLKNCDNVTIQLGYSRNVFKNKNWNIFDFCSKEDFDFYIKKSDFVISHCGVGVITNCLKNNKKPLVITRKFKNNEHINNHQVEFCNYYKNDEIFIEISDSNDLSKFISMNKKLLKPSRNYITDLKPLKRKIFQIINKQLKGNG